ncbi:Surface antigen variable number [Nostoc sp. NIES-3756]|uniref:ShlB/FhaC/HecB family hemolysin secretion/activation protein n=1 Tax=Nostoc sp. NIES-3756 TaxID=1751286 RepID=UPI00071F575C|nr:ShlB/FhaC/HecB family hemolysin secretion/activation protein [Nostoc sp. NIES-3756]BAT51706.1 Surface antigen variable number [Nostoc sp. NIES-3756]
MIYRHPKLAVSWLSLSIFLLLNSIDVQPVKAQAVNQTQQLPQPQDIQPPTPPPLPSPEPPQQLPPPAELLEPPSGDINPQQPTPTDTPQTIIVQRFEVVGSTVFSQEELAQATAEFTQRPITLAELFQARSKITELYVRRGYITSGAYIPPQTIQSGVIKIQVVEGRLEDIQITGNRRLNPSYVRSRLAIATQPPLNREKLLEALQLLQLNPLIQNLSAELSAGSRPGTSVLQVQIAEAKTRNVQLAVDNGRSPGVGSFRRRIQVSEANLLGLGDSLSAGYSNTDGSNTFDTSYTLPFNPRNGTLGFSFGTSSSRVIEKPFNTLDIDSSSRYYEITYRQPLVQSPTQELAIGLTASRRESEISSSVLTEFRVPLNELSPGADEQGRTRISALRFFQEWTTRNSREVFAVRSQFNLGIGALNATVNAQEPDSRFFSWQGQAQWARLLAPETLLIVKANTQIASTRLLSLEQFGLGGLDSVRGYRQDYLLTDNGAFASAEVQIPVLRLSQNSGLLQVTPFVDFGVAWNNQRENPDPNALAAVGLGLRWSSGDRFTARLDWGIPLISVDSEARTWQENGLYFSLIYNNPF